MDNLDIRQGRGGLSEKAVKESIYNYSPASGSAHVLLPSCISDRWFCGLMNMDSSGFAITELLVGAGNYCELGEIFGKFFLILNDVPGDIFVSGSNEHTLLCKWIGADSAYQLVDCCERVTKSQECKFDEQIEFPTSEAPYIVMNPFTDPHSEESVIVTLPFPKCIVRSKYISTDTVIAIAYQFSRV